MTKMLRWYLRLLAGLTIISGLGQLGLPAQLGAASAWGVAPGWQREIGFWDLAMYIVIARTLRANDAVGARTVAIALVGLQLLVATNHLAAAITRSPNAERDHVCGELRLCSVRHRSSPLPRGRPRSCEPRGLTSA